jgi:hypothetical protein
MMKKIRSAFFALAERALVASIVLVFTLATPVSAAETLCWTNQTKGNFQWTDTNHWRTAAVPAPHAAPVNGDTIKMEAAYSLSNCCIDVAGANLTLPTGTFAKPVNSAREWIFYDSATLTPNGSPPSPQTNFTPVTAGQTLVQAANASTQVLTLSQVTGTKGGTFYYYIPISVSSNMIFQETGVEHYYGNVSAGGVLPTSNKGWTTDVYFHGGITISGTFIQNYRSDTLNDGQQLYLEGPININTMDHQGGEIYIAATASGTYTNYNLKNGWLYNASSAITVSNMNWTGGSYFANGSSALALLGSSVTVPTNSALSIGVAQSSLPAMTTVPAYGSIAGNMTGAIYSGVGKNVTLNENAVFGGTNVVPTRADVGGAKLYMGIANGSTGGPYVVGDDGSTSLYKGFAFGNAWTTSATFNKQLTAIGGDLAGYISYVGLINNNGNIWMGDGTSHTANVKFSPAGYLKLTQSFNVGQSGANLITTFNLTRDAAGAETANILDIFATTGKILAGQTVNVVKGSIGTTQNLRNGGLLGTLTLSNGVFAQPTSAFTALDTGKLHFGDRAVVDLTNTNNLGYLEALGTDDVTCSGRPIALFFGNYSTCNLNLGANQVLAKVLGSCDLIWNTYMVVTFTSDLPVGHARFAYNCWDRTDSQGAMNPKVGTEKITYATNAPAGETPWIGFAATAQSLQIGMVVDAPAAIVQCGTDDPTRLVRSGAFTGVTANNTVTFTNTVTAAGVRILSGTAAFSKNLSTTNLHIGTNATLDANSKIFTISGTVSGSGTAQECTNLTFSTVAPGLTNGCGNLTWSTANSFRMPANATYEWGMATTNTAGVTYDLITATGKAIFGGAWTLKLVDNGFTNVLDGTEVFKIVAGTAAPVGFVVPTITAPDTGYKVGSASVYTNGYNIMLTGVTGTALPPPRGTLISFQ